MATSSVSPPIPLVVLPPAEFALCTQQYYDHILQGHTLEGLALACYIYDRTKSFERDHSASAIISPLFSELRACCIKAGLASLASGGAPRLALPAWAVAAAAAAAVATPSPNTEFLLRAARRHPDGVEMREEMLHQVFFIHLSSPFHDIHSLTTLFVYNI